MPKAMVGNWSEEEDDEEEESSKSDEKDTKIYLMAKEGEEDEDEVELTAIRLQLRIDGDSTTIWAESSLHLSTDALRNRKPELCPGLTVCICRQVKEDSTSSRLLLFGQLRSRKNKIYSLPLLLQKNATCEKSRSGWRQGGRRYPGPAQPWVTTIHGTESHHPYDDGPSQSIRPPQADDQSAQLMRLIP
ncbi:hypothetical protein Taro_015703 [Colocasia esculenta]|uniref:Uncharacterized protein n=1 Tax=Colocasia esculenta TaxID=4460 RepID=A0A843UI93_COLES|nr:hypothetical protein [Colocasia esculenta]